ncbi:HD-GYP domain-containing protein [Carboxydothermus ferrireducens]|uniref:Nucleotidyltransferase with HDIG domain n=1 Tax=Carboxydothermus ferrireducens DSM 11255 TaxID=1119529 RepID=A0ABX2RBW7_9THEO|nr:HD-GYP domain-containing protein [Carboxydothermus ferrireducens]NYE58682.1 putative nucleotidyltransferase with HDIG domain [Carboxydothermus ferrireducens DSM 11255]
MVDQIIGDFHRLRFLALVGALLFFLCNSEPINKKAFLIFLIAVIYSIVLYAYLLKKPEKRDFGYKVSFWLDCLLLTALIYYTGLGHSLFYFGYVLLVAIHTFYYGPQFGLLTATVSTAMYFIVCYLDPEVKWFDFLFKAGFLFVMVIGVAVVYWENYRLKKLYLEEISKLRDLTAKTQKIAQIQDLKELADFGLKMAVNISGALAGIVWVLDERRKNLHPIAVFGIEKKDLPWLLPAEFLSSLISAENCEAIIAGESFTKLTFEKNYQKVYTVCLAGKEQRIGFLNLYGNGEFKNLDYLTIFCGYLASQMSIVRLYEQSKELCFSITQALVMAIEAKDSYTAGHSQRVTAIAEKIGKKLGFSQERLEKLRKAALLHDIGKIGISEKILNKPGKLLPEEYREIQNHPGIGVEIIKPIEQMQDIIEIIYHHHEWYDGTGYPARLKGEEIPLEARVLAVADAFEAMTSDRSYRKALTKEEAIAEIIKQKGKQFDPQVVEAFLEVVKEDGG